MSNRYEADEGVDPTSVWIRTLLAWHTSFALLLSLSAIAMFLVAPVGTAIACAGLMLALGLGYAIFGVRAARDRDTVSRWVYLGLAAVVLLFATWLVPSAGVLLFVLYPQCWLLASRERDGVLATLGLALAAAAGPALGGATSLNDWRTAAPSLIVGAAFSVALGLFILRLIDQSRERAVLLEKLTSTQDELAAAHHAAGVVAERERLAAEIHDTLAQGFTSIAMQAEAALARPGLDFEADRLQLIARTARDNLAEARALVAAFIPAPLEDAGLVEAVRRVAGRFQEETGIDVAVTVEGGVEGLHRDHDVVLLRAVQEGLANVRKHADAHQVRVSLLAVDGTLTAEVRDDGVGFATPSSAGFGIATMTNRVRDVGGAVDLTSAPGLGTRLRVAIPQPEAVRDF
jgi:signal transduction histidine kinase